MSIYSLKTVALLASLCVVACAQSKRPFTVVDDVETAVFGGTWGGNEDLVFSPDRRYFVVETERGRSDLNEVEDAIRFYRSSDVTNFVETSAALSAPSPVWEIHDVSETGQIFTEWRWLPDSSGLVFLQRTKDENYCLMLADLHTRTLDSLTGPEESIRQFDVRDRGHYVYTATRLSVPDNASARQQSAATVATGHSLYQLLFPDSRIGRAASLSSFDKPRLFAVLNSRHFEVRNGSRTVTPFGGLGISPDGTSVITALPVPEVPTSWEVLYPPPYPSAPNRIHAGRDSAHHYVRIDLQTGEVQPLTDSPVSRDLGPSWSTVIDDRPNWSNNGEAVVLPGSYLRSSNNRPSRPCIAVVNLRSGNSSCVQILTGLREARTQKSFRLIQDAHFTNGNEACLSIRFRRPDDLYSIVTVNYEKAPDGTWRTPTQCKNAPHSDNLGFEVQVSQTLNDPPKVVAELKGHSKILWDPNPQLADVQLSTATVYEWKDRDGRSWHGGLFKPNNYQRGNRYPLVIQTHGFAQSRFIPSGVFPTAFAARELAAAGMIVLQVADLERCLTISLEELPCAVAGYEGAVRKLVSDRLVDPDRIGIIGFSRSCSYVMETLTLSGLRLRAASITSGVAGSYFQYIAAEDLSGNALANELNAIIGAKPFGGGLQAWLKRSPGFNMAKVRAPLLVSAEGMADVLTMWEPYAALHYLNRPVDLMVLNTEEHVLSNPRVRIASQGSSVDWFRFWLQDYEDRDPAKLAQYARWRKLRKMKAASD